MKNQTNTIRLSKDGTVFVVTINGHTAFFNSNLVKYQLGIAYTKKDGKVVSESEIKEMKTRSQEAYISKKAEAKKGA